MPSQTVTNISTSSSEQSPSFVLVRISAGDRPAIHTAGFDFDDRLMETMCDVYFAILEQ